MKVRVRMYNVGFGDCFLLTMDPGAGRVHRVLFDCGRHAGSKPTDTAAGETPFRQIVEQLVRDVTDADGVPRLDVIVATHRHRDHVHGFAETDLWKRVAVREVWLPWIEDPHDDVGKRLAARQERAAVRAFHALRALAAAGGAGADDAVEIAYNSTSNARAMETLTGGAGFATVPRLRYLPRAGHEPDLLGDDDLAGVLPAGVRVHVLGPSRDPRVIAQLDPPTGRAYEPLQPRDRALPAAEGVPGTEVGVPPLPFAATWRVPAAEYRFADGEAEAIAAMVAGATTEPLELVYRLDEAINGTSLVLLVEVEGAKLLFPGDAQWGTWNVMLGTPATRALLDGTAVYKVGHHGSHNATPVEFVEQLLSKQRTQLALVSAAPTNYKGGWQNIPLPTLVRALERRTAKVVVTESATAAAPQPQPRSPSKKAAVTPLPTVYDNEVVTSPPRRAPRPRRRPA